MTQLPLPLVVTCGLHNFLVMIANEICVASPCAENVTIYIDLNAGNVKTDYCCIDLNSDCIFIPLPQSLQVAMCH